MSAEINRDEWLKALQDAGLDGDTDPHSLTATEFASMFDMTATTARRRLEALVAAKSAVRTRKRMADSAGRMVVCTAYRLVS